MTPKGLGVHCEEVKSQMKSLFNTLSGPNEANASGWGNGWWNRWWFLYTMNSSQQSDFLAFQRHRHHERESSHFQSAQVLQCSCQGSFLAGPYLQRSVPVGHDPLEAAFPTLTCSLPSTEKAAERCWMSAGIHQLPQLTLCPSCYIPATGQHCCCHISFWVTTDNCSEIQKKRLWCWAATSDRMKTSGPRFCRIKEAVYHSLAEWHPKIPLILAKPIIQTSFSACYFAPADSSCLDKGNYTLRDWYFKKEWVPWLNNFWKVTFVFKDNVQMIGKWEVGPISSTRKFDSLGMLLVHLHLWWWGLNTNLSSTTQVLSPKVGES